MKSNIPYQNYSSLSETISLYFVLRYAILEISSSSQSKKKKKKRVNKQYSLFSLWEM